MHPRDPDHRDDEQIEALLRRSQPSPSRMWVRETERELFGAPARAKQAWRPFTVAGAAAAGLAGLAFALALVGGSPLQSGGPGSVDAKDRCATVTTTTVKRQAHLVVGKDGQPHIRYTRRPVTKTAKVCR
jgi:hypothetical protein